MKLLGKTIGRKREKDKCSSYSDKVTTTNSEREHGHHGPGSGSCPDATPLNTGIKDDNDLISTSSRSMNTGDNTSLYQFSIVANVAPPSTRTKKKKKLHFRHGYKNKRSNSINSCSSDDSSNNCSHDEPDKDIDDEPIRYCKLDDNDIPIPSTNSNTDYHDNNTNVNTNAPITTVTRTKNTYTYATKKTSSNNVNHGDHNSNIISTTITQSATEGPVDVDLFIDNANQQASATDTETIQRNLSNNTFDDFIVDCSFSDYSSCCPPSSNASSSSSHASSSSSSSSSSSLQKSIDSSLQNLGDDNTQFSPNQKVMPQKQSNEPETWPINGYTKTFFSSSKKQRNTHNDENIDHNSKTTTSTKDGKKLKKNTILFSSTQNNPTTQKNKSTIKKRFQSILGSNKLKDSITTTTSNSRPRLKERMESLTSITPLVGDAILDSTSSKNPTTCCTITTSLPPNNKPRPLKDRNVSASSMIPMTGDFNIHYPSYTTATNIATTATTQTQLLKKPSRHNYQPKPSTGTEKEQFYSKKGTTNPFPKKKENTKERNVQSSFHPTVNKNQDEDTNQPQYPSIYPLQQERRERPQKDQVSSAFQLQQHQDPKMKGTFKVMQDQEFITNTTTPTTGTTSTREEEYKQKINDWVMGFSSLTFDTNELCSEDTTCTTNTMKNNNPFHMMQKFNINSNSNNDGSLIAPRPNKQHIGPSNNRVNACLTISTIPGSGTDSSKTPESQVTARIENTSASKSRFDFFEPSFPTTTTTTTTPPGNEEMSNPTSLDNTTTMTTSNILTSSITPTNYLCVVCHKSDRTHLAMPCMHFSYCEDCAMQLSNNNDVAMYDHDSTTTDGIMTGGNGTSNRCYCRVCNQTNVTFTKVFY